VRNYLFTNITQLKTLQISFYLKSKTAYRKM